MGRFHFKALSSFILMGAFERVRVIGRIRPFIPSDPDDVDLSTIVIDKKHASVDGKYVYSLDAIYPMETLTDEIFKEAIEPLINDFLSGYNIALMAYGQTGTGKTYTVSGLTPLVLEKIVLEGFQGNIEELSFQFIEVYGDTIRDLLSEDPVESSKTLQVYDDATTEGRTLLTGAVRIRARTLRQVMEVVEYGTRMRATGATNIHEYSSRSHSIFTIFNHRDNSKLHLVDLAGSERANKTQNIGQRFQESIGINVGLLALGNVIRALRRNHTQGTHQHVPYRSSKLTRLLQDSLGGNSRTIFIACIAPDSLNRDETKRTLEYCTLAQQILNTPIPNYAALYEEQYGGGNKGNKGNAKTEEYPLHHEKKKSVLEQDEYDITVTESEKFHAEISRLKKDAERLTHKVSVLKRELKKDEDIFRKQIHEIQRLAEENKMWRRRVDFLEGRPHHFQHTSHSSNAADAISVVERVMRLHGLTNSGQVSRVSSSKAGNDSDDPWKEVDERASPNNIYQYSDPDTGKTHSLNSAKGEYGPALDSSDLFCNGDNTSSAEAASNECVADIAKKILSYQIENANYKGKIISLEALLDKQCRESAMLRVELAQLRKCTFSSAP